MFVRSSIFSDDDHNFFDDNWYETTDKLFDSYVRRGMQDCCKAFDLIGHMCYWYGHSYMICLIPLVDGWQLVYQTQSTSDSVNPTFSC